jgi:hypothetical protein
MAGGGGGRELRHLCFCSRRAEEFAKPGGPDMERIVETGAEPGIHFVQE